MARKWQHDGKQFDTARQVAVAFLGERKADRDDWKRQLTELVKEKSGVILTITENAADDQDELAFKTPKVRGEVYEETIMLPTLGREIRETLERMVVWLKEARR